MSESIRFGRVSSRSVDEREVKPGQEEGPACLPAVQVLGSPEVCEVPMVIQDLYGVFGSFNNVSPLFQALDDGQELFVMYLIVPLSTGKTLGCESHWVPFVILAQLG